MYMTRTNEDKELLDVGGEEEEQNEIETETEEDAVEDDEKDEKNIEEDEEDGEPVSDIPDENVFPSEPASETQPGEMDEENDEV